MKNKSIQKINQAVGMLVTVYLVLSLIARETNNTVLIYIFFATSIAVLLFAIYSLVKIILIKAPVKQKAISLYTLPLLIAYAIFAIIHCKNIIF